MRLGDDGADERVAVGVDAIGREADDDISGFDAGCVGSAFEFDDADRETGEVDVSRLVEVGHFGGFAAHELATEAMGRAHATMERIAALSAHDEETLPELVEHLSDVDMAVLERSRLSDLLLLGRRPGDADASVAELEQLQDRLTSDRIGISMPVRVVRGGELREIPVTIAERRRQSDER